MKEIKNKLNDLSPNLKNDKKDSKNQSTVKDYLQRLFPNTSSTKYFPDTRLQQQASGLEELVGGHWINTPFGDIFRSEFVWDLNEMYGNYKLSTIYSIEKSAFSHVFNTPLLPSWESLIFLDTETTGLIGGTGTVAFMVGIGFIKNRYFHVHQYFISHLSHEEGMLELVRSLMDSYHTVVTYNGKIYDIPLLNTRFVMNHLPPLDEDMPHGDLLHPSRNLWKFSQENCKLITLEREKLGFEREEDIPGELIPGIYFEYMRLNRIDMLTKVFIHNRWDIITLLALLIRVIESYGQLHAEENPLDDYAKGRLFKNRQEYERSIAHYRHVLSSNITPQRRQKTLLELGALLKKLGYLEDALAAWTEACDILYLFSYEGYVERAIYYEHREKNLEKALSVVKEALARIPSYRQAEIESLCYRQNRLQRKIEAKSNHDRHFSS
ncbi:MAG: ribonuclease H-like domain-containing protein [Candidatus Marinimicrobia bacterium]|nr:ribonuclease H-like domain-containing protein [Candidatus Neomarinimicrobiota bacterium]MDD5582686.1 ribonuclease H-like domain-containing protein [Candidatus Neomarinimicrobiota bacterium]